MKEYIKSLDENLKYIKHEEKKEAIYIYCETKTKKIKHPTKNIETKSIKHRYDRIIDDLPFANKKIKLVLKVKVFNFRKLPNKENLMVETLAFLSEKYQRSKRTKRLEKYILDIANNGSSISTEKTLNRLGVKISDTTLNRMIKKK